MRAPGREETETLLEMFAVGVGGLVAGILVSTLLGRIVVQVGVSLDTLAAELVVSVVGLALGFALTAATYLQFRQLPVSYLRIRMPTPRDLGWVLLGTLSLLGLVTLIGGLVEILPLQEPSQHPVIEQAEQQPNAMLVMMGLSVLFVGPSEELLFRGLIQTRLVGAYGQHSGIVVTSVVFASAHVPAYFGDGLGVSLVILCSLSLVIGWLYERTETLVVPALVHGSYNAVLFGGVYVSLTTDLL